MLAIILEKAHPEQIPKAKTYAVEAEGPYQVILTAVCVWSLILYNFTQSH